MALALAVSSRDNATSTSTWCGTTHARSTSGWRSILFFILFFLLASIPSLFLAFSAQADVAAVTFSCIGGSADSVSFVVCSSDVDNGGSVTMTAGSSSSSSSTGGDVSVTTGFGLSTDSVSIAFGSSPVIGTGSSGAAALATGSSASGSSGSVSSGVSSNSTSGGVIVSTSVTVTTGSHSSPSGTGGSVVVSTGDRLSTSSGSLTLGSSGSATLSTGSSLTGSSGTINMSTGSSQGLGGNVAMNSGSSSSSSSGSLSIISGSSSIVGSCVSSSGISGGISVELGSSPSFISVWVDVLSWLSSGASGSIEIESGSSTSGPSGSVVVGSGSASKGSSGSIVVSDGSSVGGNAGSVSVNVGTSDVSDGGSLTVTAGSTTTTISTTNPSVSNSPSTIASASFVPSRSSTARVSASSHVYSSLMPTRSVSLLGMSTESTSESIATATPTVTICSTTPTFSPFASNSPCESIFASSSLSTTSPVSMARRAFAMSTASPTPTAAASAGATESAATGYATASSFAAASVSSSSLPSATTVSASLRRLAQDSIGALAAPILKAASAYSRVLQFFTTGISCSTWLYSPGSLSPLGVLRAVGTYSTGDSIRLSAGGTADSLDSIGVESGCARNGTGGSLRIVGGSGGYSGASSNGGMSGSMSVTTADATAASIVYDVHSGFSGSVLGDSAGGSKGGDVTICSGRALDANASSGTLSLLIASGGMGIGYSSSVSITQRNACDTGGRADDVTLTLIATTASSGVLGVGGAAAIVATGDAIIGTGDGLTLLAGAGAAVGGHVTLTAGAASEGTGGSIMIMSGNLNFITGDASTSAGDIIFAAGSGSHGGSIVMATVVGSKTDTCGSANITAGGDVVLEAGGVVHISGNDGVTFSVANIPALTLSTDGVLASGPATTEVRLVATGLLGAAHLSSTQGPAGVTGAEASLKSTSSSEVVSITTTALAGDTSSIMMLFLIPVVFLCLFLHQSLNVLPAALAVAPLRDIVATGLKIAPAKKVLPDHIDLKENNVATGNDVADTAGSAITNVVIGAVIVFGLGDDLTIRILTNVDIGNPVQVVLSLNNDDNHSGQTFSGVVLGSIDSPWNYVNINPLNHSPEQIAAAQSITAKQVSEAKVNLGINDDAVLTEELIRSACRVRMNKARNNFSSLDMVERNAAREKENAAFIASRQFLSDFLSAEAHGSELKAVIRKLPAFTRLYPNLNGGELSVCLSDMLSGSSACAEFSTSLPVKSVKSVAAIVSSGLGFNPKEVRVH